MNPKSKKSKPKVIRRKTGALVVQKGRRHSLRTKPEQQVSIPQTVREFTMEELRKRCPACDQNDLTVFYEMCRAYQLNPYTGEISAMKIGDDPAVFIPDYKMFIKRAEQDVSPDGKCHYRGMKSGVIVLPKGKTMEERVYRDGALFSPEQGEVLLGGWCEVYRDDRPEHPTRAEVSLQEFKRLKRDGSVMATWMKPAMMIEKCAIGRAHRFAHPNALAKLYLKEELGAGYIQGEIQPPEIGLAPAINKKEPEPEQKPNPVEEAHKKAQNRFFAIANRKNLKKDDAYKIAGIESMKLLTAEEIHKAGDKLEEWVAPTNDGKSDRKPENAIRREIGELIFDAVGGDSDKATKLFPILTLFESRLKIPDHLLEPVKLICQGYHETEPEKRDGLLVILKSLVGETVEEKVIKRAKYFQGFVKP